MILASRESDVLRLIRRHGPLSRHELHKHMGLRPNTIGDLAAAMIARRLLREGDCQSTGRGRPRLPLEIDAQQRRVIGLALEPGRVSACQLNLHGLRVGGQLEQVTHSPKDLVSAASTLLESMRTEDALAVGISATGFVDSDTRSILTSSATFRQLRTSLDPVYAAAGDCPVLLENDMHAQAAYWQLSQDTDCDEDVLMTLLADGAIGATLLVAGKPNRGCINGGNELGHMRLPVETDRCYCGQTGCLERICSSEFLRRLPGDDHGDLTGRLMSFDEHDPAIAPILQHLATGIANAINFVRPNRVVLTGPLVPCTAFCNNLVGLIRGYLLAPLKDRVRIDIWDRPHSTPAQFGAWLALAAIYQGGWGSATSPADASATPGEKAKSLRR